MVAFFTKTSIGYSHIGAKKPCQDFSASYHDEERTIVTACDGHGGDIYIRSQLGSRFASDSIISVLKGLDKSSFYKYTEREIADKIRLNILCEWNNLVEAHLEAKPIAKREMTALQPKDIARLKSNPATAYGTTLQGVMILGNKLVCVSLGDGGVFLVRRGEIKEAFEEDEETVANLTYSMCQANAYEHLKVKIFDFSALDGAIVCTDGLVNPYQSLSNFNQSLVKPICVKLIERDYEEIESFVKRLGTEIGIGDDVSLGVAIRKSTSLRSYKR